MSGLYPNPYNRRFVALPAWDPIEQALTHLRKAFPDMELVKTTDLPEEEERTLHPEGTYKAIVTNCIAKKSKQGNDMLEFTLKTEKGKLRHWLVYIPTKRFILERFYQSLAAVQVGEAAVESAADWDEIALMTVKADVLITVTHEDQGGKTRDVVSGFDHI